MKFSLAGGDAFQFFLKGPNNGTKMLQVLFFEDSVFLYFMPVAPIFLRIRNDREMKVL